MVGEKEKTLKPTGDPSGKFIYVCIKWLLSKFTLARPIHACRRTLQYLQYPFLNITSSHTLNPCANKRNIQRSLYVWARNNTAWETVTLTVCHTCNFEDRGDYDKNVLLTLPAQREAEVVALFHATVHHRHHDFLHARWCKLHCATTYVLRASSNGEAGWMFIRPFKIRQQQRFCNGKNTWEHSTRCTVSLYGRRWVIDRWRKSHVFSMSAHICLKGKIINCGCLTGNYSQALIHYFRCLQSC